MSDWRNEAYQDDEPIAAADARVTGVLQREDGRMPPVLHAAFEPAALARPSSEAMEIDTLRLINARLIREIADLKQREAHALQLADRDGLTGLYNRRRLSELLAGAIEEAARQGDQLGVLFIDLDGFKRINDEFGHDGR
jgi:predicted signal transduction protein with EAL and GGDEF domain